MFGRITAEHLSATTHCLVIGASEYECATLRPLPAAASEAQDLKQALTAAAGLAIPPVNIQFLAGQTATVDAAKEALKALRRRATPESTVFFYFAGHGTSVGPDEFGLCLRDTKSTADPLSMITSSDLQELWAGDSARGIVFVLDCCGGAGLAERSPALFSAVGQADYRILLSASRQSQSSWETAQGSAFSKHLVAALSGKVRIGDEPGFIYFNDLYTYLHDSVLEAHESAGLPLQEPVFAGSYLRDPLLFVHGQLSRVQIVVKTKRYSREYLQRRLRLWGAGVAAAAAVATGLYWTYLDQLQHLRLTDRGLLLRKGHPSLQGFGMPADIWTFYVARDEIRPQSPLARGEDLMSPLGQPVLPLVPDQLNELGRVRWQWSQGDRGQALADLRAFADILEQKSQREILRATQLLGVFGQAADVDRLLKAFALVPEGYRRDTARSIVHFGQAQGFKRLLDGEAGPAGQALTPDTISELKIVCTPQLQSSLGTFSSSYAHKNDLPALFYVSLATGCKIPLLLLGQANIFHENVVAAHILTAYSDQAAKITESLTETLEATAKGREEQSQVGSQIRLLTLLPPGRCPNIENLAWLDPKWRLGLDVALVLARACPQRALQIVETEQGFELQLSSPGSTDWVVIQRVEPTTKDTLNFLLDLLQVLRRMPINGDEALLRRLVADSSDEIIARTAMQILFARSVSPPESVPRFFQTTYQPLAVVAHAYWAQTHRAEVINGLIQKLDDQVADYVLTVLAFLRPNAAERHKLLQSAASERVPIARRAALTVMYGESDDVMRAICARDPEIRSAANDALGFRTDLAAIASLPQPSECQYVRLKEDLDQIEEARSVLKTVLAAGSPELRNLRMNIALFFHPTHNEGLRRWLRAQCLDCF